MDMHAYVHNIDLLFFPFCYSAGHWSSLFYSCRRQFLIIRIFLLKLQTNMLTWRLKRHDDTTTSTSLFHFALQLNSVENEIFLSPLVIWYPCLVTMIRRRPTIIPSTSGKFFWKTSLPDSTKLILLLYKRIFFSAELLLMLINPDMIICSW